MSYLAIARKYRPATFEGIVGQEHVTRTLKNAIERDRIHHGYVFTGARGVGKTTAARALARSLNCVSGPTATPCGECTSCVEVAAGRSPDLIEIDGASNNSVDDIRELRDTVRYAPTQGKWKIYLIDEVHMLSKGAFNALLKTLEEPPAHVVFIFATTEPNKIPDTILSRVQRFDFKRIPVPAVVAHLGEIAGKEGVTISDNALRLVARAGEGSMRDAQSLLDQVISFAGQDISDDQVAETLGLIDRGLLYDMLEGLVTGQPDKALATIATVYSYGYELSEFTGEMLEVLRNAAFCRLSKVARDHVDVSEDELVRLDQITDGADVDALNRTFHAMLDVHDQVSRASRPRIVLEMAVARLADNRPLQPIGALVGRLEAMERHLRQAGVRPSSSGPRGRSSRGSGSTRPSGSDDRGARPTTTPDASTPERREPPKAAVVADPPAAVHRAEPPRAQGNQPGPPEPPDSHYDSVASSAPASADHAPDAPDARQASPPQRGGERASQPLDPKQRWRGFIGRLNGTQAAFFAKGKPEWQAGEPLRVTFTGARDVALARRYKDSELVHDAMVLSYPQGTELVVIDRAVTGDIHEDLLRQAARDPDLQRIINTLGAKPVAARPLKTPDKENP